MHSSTPNTESTARDLLVEREVIDFNRIKTALQRDADGTYRPIPPGTPEVLMGGIYRDPEFSQRVRVNAQRIKEDAAGTLGERVLLHERGSDLARALNRCLTELQSEITLHRQALAPTTDGVITDASPPPSILEVIWRGCRRFSSDRPAADDDWDPLKPMRDAYQAYVRQCAVELLDAVENVRLHISGVVDQMSNDRDRLLVVAHDAAEEARHRARQRRDDLDAELSDLPPGTAGLLIAAHAGIRPGATSLVARGMANTGQDGDLTSPEALTDALEVLLRPTVTIKADVPQLMETIHRHLGRPPRDAFRRAADYLAREALPRAPRRATNQKAGMVVYQLVPSDALAALRTREAGVLKTGRFQPGLGHFGFLAFQGDLDPAEFEGMAEARRALVTAERTGNHRLFGRRPEAPEAQPPGTPSASATEAEATTDEPTALKSVA
ncbi:MAG: hypothetical protein ACKVVP_18505 [Chloroflexota bacterium]